MGRSRNLGQESREGGSRGLRARRRVRDVLLWTLRLPRAHFQFPWGPRWFPFHVTSHTAIPGCLNCFGRLLLQPGKSRIPLLLPKDCFQIWLCVYVAHSQGSCRIRVRHYNVLARSTGSIARPHAWKSQFCCSLGV